MPSSLRKLALPVASLLAILIVFSFFPTLIVKGDTADPDSKYYFPLIQYHPAAIRLGPDGGRMYSLAIDPQDPSILYAGSYGGMYKSVDAGETWFPIRNGMPSVQWIQAIEVDPHNSNIVFASAYKDYLYRSSDGGANWTPVYLDAGHSTSVIYSIEIDPHNSQQIFLALRLPPYTGAGTPALPYNGNIYRSQDGGTNWADVTSGLTRLDGSALSIYFPYSVVVNPDVPGMLAAAYDATDPTKSPGLYISTDNGDHWTANSGLSIAYANSKGRDVLFLDYISPGTMYYSSWGSACFSGKPYDLLRTPDGGLTWPLSGYCGTDFNKLAATHTAPYYVYATTGQNGLSRILDSGSLLVLGDAALQVGGSTVWVPNSLAINPLDGNDVYVAAYYTATGLTTDTNYLNEGIFKTTNGNDAIPSWSVKKQGLSATWSTSTLALPGDPNHLYLASYVNGVFESLDRGATWSNINANLSNINIHNLIFNPDHNKLFALTDTEGLWSRSIPDGTWWSKVNAPTSPPLYTTPGYAFPGNHPFNPPESPDADLNPASDVPQSPETLPTGVPFLSMAFSNQNSQVAYLASSGRGLYKSLDGGTTWAITGLDWQVVTSFSMDPQNNNTLYASTCSVPCTTTDARGITLYMIKSSTNAGSSWNSSFSNPPYSVLAVAMSPTNPSVLYAGTSNGVYRYDSGTWTPLGPAGLTVTALAFNPARNGYLYAGTTFGAVYSTDSGASWLAGPAELNGLTITNIQFDPNRASSVYYSTKFGSSLLVP